MTLGVGQKAFMYARSGVLRSGASRSGYYQSYLLVKIGGTDRTTALDKGTLSIDYQLGQQPDTGSVKVFGFDPSPGQTVIVCDGAADNRVFAGTVQRARQLSVRAAAKKRWALTLTDWTWFLNRRRVFRQYAAGTLANLAFADLVTSYSSGFSVAKVKSGAPALTGAMAFRGTPLADALTQIADASPGWRWWPDPDQVTHFNNGETEQAPTNLSAGVLTYDNLEYLLDISQIRTRMYGVGAGAQTTAPVLAGATTVPVNECGWYTTLPGKFLSGANVVTFTGTSATSGAGSLTGCSAIAYDIKAGDTLNVFVQTDDAAAQTALAALEGGDGIHEGWVENGNWSLATTTQQVTAALAAFKNQDVRGSYDSSDRFTAVGKQVGINITARGINTTVTLQHVNRRLASPLGRVGGIGGGWAFRADFSIVWSDLVDLLVGAVNPS